mgnify:CR=1 FL=1
MGQFTRGKALKVAKPAFPPRAPPFRARNCCRLWECVKVLAGRWILRCRLRKVEPIYTDVNVLAKRFFIRSVRKAVCEADLFLNNSEITAIQVIRRNSGNRPAMQAAFPSALNEQSAQPDAVSTAEYRTEPIHLHIPQRTTAAWPGGEEREKGRRPSQL